jgi:hypothetical protein
MYVCWPVLVYRVTAPVLRVRHLNIIEKVVLGLCQAGIRQSADIAAKIRQDPELCEYVLRQLRDGEQVDRHGSLTEKGQQTLADRKASDEPELIVTHVFQDPLTGRLWPRAARELRFERVHSVRADRAELRLGPAAERRPESALIVTAGADPGQPRRPAPQEIIDAVAAHRRAEIVRRAERFTDRSDGRSPAARVAEGDLEALSTELVPESSVHRVLDVSRPMADYLLLWLQDGGEAAGSLRVRDPFGLEPNPALHKMLADRIRLDPKLAETVAGAADASATHKAERYQTARHVVERDAEARLVRELGGELRRHPQVLVLLVGLEEAAARGGAAGLESVAREVLRLYEYLFRRVVAEYPPPERPSWEAGRRPAPWQTIQGALEKAAASMGLALPRQLCGSYGRKVAAYYQKSSADRAAYLEHAFIHQLLPLAVVVAGEQGSASRLGHPLRELAQRNPDLISDLSRLGKLRNRGSHGERDATVADDIAWCRQLARDAARVLLPMPPQPAEGN